MAPAVSASQIQLDHGERQRERQLRFPGRPAERVCDLARLV